MPEKMIIVGNYWSYFGVWLVLALSWGYFGRKSVLSVLIELDIQVLFQVFPDFYSPEWIGFFLVQ